MKTADSVSDSVLPLLLRIGGRGGAAELASVSRSRGYELAYTEWRSFTIKIGGGRSIRVVRAGLENWIAEKLREKAASVGEGTQSVGGSQGQNYASKSSAAPGKERES